MPVILGIDLGTVNSCVAVVQNGVPQVIPNRGQLTMPSVVAFTTGGKRLVGHIAKRQAITNAEGTVSVIKRLIGRAWGSIEVERTRKTVAHGLVAGPHRDVRVEVRGETYSLPELSAMVVQELRAAAEEHLGEPVSQAVITVPAYFNDNQRQATRDAGRIAGLEVLRMLNEPTAAAIAYGIGRGKDRTIAVYDLGGGTFDISIVKVGHDGTFEVLSTAGDTFLGGEDFDARIMDWLNDSFRRENGVDLLEDRIAVQRLKDAAETAKRALSTSDRYDIDLPFIVAQEGRPAMHLARSITRDTFESLCKDLVDRTIDVCGEALGGANLGPRDIDDVVLVGGMSRVPRVRDSVRRFFGREPSQGVHPDEAIAIGAAIHASGLAAPESAKIRLLDVTPHPLGIMTAGNQFEEIIPGNTRVPARETKSFTTGRDGQTRMTIVVLQGESRDARKNELLGKFNLTDLRSAPQGEVSIEVSFAIDEDGIVDVSARDVDTGQAQSIQVTGASGLTPAEVDEMEEEARTRMATEGAAELLGAEQQAVEKLIAELAPLLSRPEVSGDARREALVAMEQGESAIESQDWATLRAAVEVLQGAKQRVKQRGG